MSKFAFKDVGRHKANWTAEIDTDQDDEVVAWEIASEIRNNGRLMSREIDISYLEGFEKGNIYAGFHKVGTFELEAA